MNRSFPCALPTPVSLSPLSLSHSAIGKQKDFLENGALIIVYVCVIYTTVFTQQRSGPSPQTVIEVQWPSRRPGIQGKKKARPSGAVDKVGKQPSVAGKRNNRKSELMKDTSRVHIHRNLPGPGSRSVPYSPQSRGVISWALPDMLLRPAGPVPSNAPFSPMRGARKLPRHRSAGAAVVWDRSGGDMSARRPLPPVNFLRRILGMTYLQRH